MNLLLDFKKIEKISKECSAIVEMSTLSQSTTSHHIKVLVEAGLIIPEKCGRKFNYTINKEVFAAFSQYVSGYIK